MIQLLVNNSKGIFDVTPFVTGDITLISQRKNTPTTLTFKFARDLVVQNNLSIAIDEGNAVELSVNGSKIYKGFVFEKSRTKEQIITIKCYDQIRYLQNKNSYTFVNKKASDVIKQISSEFNLQMGEIVDTGYILPPYNADNQSLLDIIMQTLDLTSYNSNELYIFYDAVGKLTLKKVKDMVTDFVFTDETNITDFSYLTSIDKQTFDVVKLYRDNKDTGQREYFIAKDNMNVGKWGILQHFEKADENMNDAQIKKLAEDILKLKNKISETLTVDVQNNDFSNKLETLRAGNFVYVVINGLGSSNFSKVCLVEKCTHTFNDNYHKIKLELNGGA